ANSFFGIATLSLYQGQADGTFAYLRDIKVGTSISDVALTDVNGDGRPDLVVTNPDSGDVGLLINDTLPGGEIHFQDELRFRAGVGLYGVEESGVSVVGNQLFQDVFGIAHVFPPLYFVVSTEETSSLVSGDFTGDGVNDLIVTNRGSNTFSLLAGKQGV